MVTRTYDVFLSYNHEDRDLALTVATELRDAGINPWFDEWCISGGTHSQSAMESGLMESKSFAVLIGPHNLGRWTRAEMDVALDRGAIEDDFQVIPVLLPTIPAEFSFQGMPAFLRRYSAIDLRKQPIARLVEAIRGVPHPMGNGIRTDRREAVPVDIGIRERDRGPETSAPTAHTGLLEHNLARLRDHISEGNFTPVIGSGCSLIGRSQSPAWGTLTHEFEAVLACLDGEEVPSRYLRALGRVPAFDIPLKPLGASLPPPAQESPIVQLQVALARLGAKFGELFASTMLASALPVWDTASYKVRIPEDDHDLLRTTELLVEGCAAAYALKGTHEGRTLDIGLEATGIYLHLVELTGELGDGTRLARMQVELARDNPQSVHAAVLRDVESFRKSQGYSDQVSRTIDLSIHQLEWIADALWHTFRYNKAAYPRTDELAFQVSLIVGSGRSKKAPLTVMWEGARSIVSAHILSAWFRRYSEHPSPSMLAFYDALAHILNAQMEDYRETAQRRGLSGGADSASPMLPVALTTNFDLEMEAALQRSAGCRYFHVVVPVNAYRPGKHQNPEPEWLFGTIGKQHSLEEPDWQWFPRDRQLRPKDIKGPVLLKLHGSPLQELPDPESLDAYLDSSGQPRYLPEYDVFEHALVLSERDYLQKIAWKDPLPELFHRVLLHPGRALFFLGHSVKEWSTRLRLFNQVYRPGGVPPTRAERIAINRSHDPYRSAVLNAIDINIWVGDLERVAHEVEMVLSTEEAR